MNSMRYIGLLLLASCQTTYQVSIQEPNTIPQQITTGSANGIDWKCTQEEVNDRLVWIDCNFTNSSKKTSSVCINIAYTALNGYSGFVSNDRSTCSCGLPPGTSHDNYVAFIKDERIRLDNLCGTKLNDCAMISFKVD